MMTKMHLRNACLLMVASLAAPLAGQAAETALPGASKRFTLAPTVPPNPKYKICRFSDLTNRGTRVTDDFAGSGIEIAPWASKDTVIEPFKINYIWDSQCTYDSSGRLIVEFNTKSLKDIGLWRVQAYCSAYTAAEPECLNAPCTQGVCGQCGCSIGCFSDFYHGPSGSKDICWDSWSPVYYETLNVQVRNDPPTCETSPSSSTVAWGGSIQPKVVNPRDPDGGPMLFEWSIAGHPDAASWNGRLQNSTQSQARMDFTQEKDIGIWRFAVACDDDEGQRVRGMPIVVEVPNPPTSELKIVP